MQGGETLKSLYAEGKQRLREAGLADPAFDALCLMEAVFRVDRTGLALHGEMPAEAEGLRRFRSLLEARAEGVPLQYLLGEWDFLSLRLSVREGVLIPRPETELLCETAAAYLRESGRRTVLDLCAGTGAVGLGICALYPSASVSCVEWYDTPFSCLAENLQRYPAYQVAPVRLDVLDPDAPARLQPVDVLVSNPPYIASGELPFLQEEVRREPREALDGGPDGLLFYRAIATYWLSLLLPGGLLAVEIGETQGEAVMALLARAGLERAEVRRDAAGLDRVVLARKPR